MQDFEPSNEISVLDALAEEFIARHRLGERPTLSEYIARQPELAESIRELFPALVMMENARPVVGNEPGGLVGVSGATGGVMLKQLGDYRILREIGRGGMGIVYEAEQETLGRHVALKVLPKHAMLDPRQLERFHREARAAAQLHHTNIVPVFGVGQHDGLHYHIMQFIQGLGLDEVLGEVVRLRDEKQTSTRTGKGDRTLIQTPGGDARSVSRMVQNAAAPAAARVAEALISGQFQCVAGGSVTPPVLHSLADPGLEELSSIVASDSLTSKDNCSTPQRAKSSSSDIHLPGQNSNTTESGGAYWNSIAHIGVQVADALAYANNQGVLHRDIKPSNLLLDSTGTVWVTDFGLAKTSESNDLTQTGDVVGTLRYMAPERFHGHSDVRCDIYSLGMTLYELLTLRHPFAEVDRHKLVRQISQEEPPRPRSIDRNLPRDLETIVLKAIAKQPADRYQNAESLAADLRRFIEDRPIKARRIGSAEWFWRWCRRNPVVASLAAAVFVLAIVLSVGAPVTHILRSERDRAVLNLTRAVDAEQEARQSQQRAEQAERVVQIHSHLAQAAAYRHSGQPGRRYKSLDELREAVKLKPTQSLLAELRDEAIACMALVDLRAVDVAVVGGANFLTFDQNYRQYAFFDNEGKIHIRGVGKSDDKSVLPGLGDTNLGLSFSQSGQYFAAYSVDGGATQIWQVESGEAVFSEPIQGYIGQMSPDERCAAIGLLNGSVAVYAVPSGQELDRLHTNIVPSAIAIHPLGRRVAVGLSRPPRLWIWDLDQKAVVAKLTDIHSPIHAVAWDPEGGRLALSLGTPANRAEVWDVATCTRLATMDGHSQDVTVAQFHPSENLLVTGSWDGFTRVWDISTARQIVAWPGVAQGWPDRSGRVMGHVWSHDRNQLIELITEHEFVTLASSLGAGKGEYRDGGISPDGRLLALGMDDGVRIWDLSSCREVAFLPTEQTLSPIFTPDGKELITSGDSGLQRWPVEIRSPPDSKAASPQSVATLASEWANSHSSHALANVATNVDEIHLGPPRTVPLPFVPLFAHGTSDGRTLGICSPQSNEAFILDLANDRHQAKLGPQLGLDRIVLSPNGRWAATTGWHAKTVQVWNARTGVLVNELPLGTMTLAAFSPDSRHLITSRYDEFCFWEIGTWLKTKSLPREFCPYPGMVVYSADGRVMALELSSAIISLIDVETGVTLAKLEDPYRDRPGWMSFTPDGTRLVVASTYARTVHVWDLYSIRAQLETMDLDWDSLPVSQTISQRTSVAASWPPRVIVDLGDFGPRAEVARQNKQAMRHFELANEHLQLQRWGEAVVESKRAVEANPENALYHNALAWLLATSPDPVYRDNAVAVEHARKAVQLEPESPESWNTLGVACYRIGEWQQAIDMLSKAEQLQPDTYFGHNAVFLAMAHWQLGEKETARKLLAQAAQWMSSTKPPISDREELDRFRAEAELLLKQ